jgi:hypothetical protein
MERVIPELSRCRSLPSPSTAPQRTATAAGSAAFVVALNEHNLRASPKTTSAQVIGLMRLAEPAVRRASPRVADGLNWFCDYVSDNRQPRRRSQAGRRMTAYRGQIE